MAAAVRFLGSWTYGHAYFATLVPDATGADVVVDDVDAVDIVVCVAAAVIEAIDVGVGVASSTNVTATAVVVLPSISICFENKRAEKAYAVAAGVELGLGDARILPTTAATIRHTIMPTVMLVSSFIMDFFLRMGSSTLLLLWAAIFSRIVDPVSV